MLQISAYTSTNLPPGSPLSGTQGLQPHIQSYVTLARPKDFQEAESLARMKELVEINQNASDSRSILSQMEAMFTDFCIHQY